MIHRHVPSLGCEHGQHGLRLGALLRSTVNSEVPRAAKNTEEPGC